MGSSLLTLFMMGLFGAAHGMGEAENAPLPKICHTYPTMLKLGTVMSYLKKIKKINHVTHLLRSAYITILSPKISDIFIIKKCRYRLHFNA